MHSFFVLLAIDGFDRLKLRMGYAQAVGLTDQLCEEAAAALPKARGLRANRESVEFVLQSASHEAARQSLELLRDELAGTIAASDEIGRRNLTLVGVRCEQDGPTESLVAQAETLLRQAQRSGQAVTLADADRPERQDEELMRELRRAIDGEGLALHYQPKLRARTGELAGTEALLRWTHPQLGKVPPDQFIGAAERSGDIRELTRWVLSRAIADQAMLAEGGCSVPTYINISAPLLAEPDFAAEMLDRVDGLSHLIGFEITETAMITDPEGTLARLHQIAEAGVQLAIDDYGTGFSSLAYLQRLPVHELKIDRMFIGRLSTNPRDPLLVRSTINLAHALEMTVTAEGVETAASLALLQVMGCDLVQGFFLSAALPPSELLAFSRGAASSTALARPATLRERLAERRSHGGAA